VIGTRIRKHNRKRIKNRNFTQENVKVEKSENLCCQTGTTLRPVGTGCGYGSLMVCTTVRPVGATMRPVMCLENPIFRFFVNV